MTQVICDPGVCGNAAKIEVTIDLASTEGGRRPIAVTVLSQCKKVSVMAKRLSNLKRGELNDWDAIEPRGESKICRWAAQSRLCTACPIPMAILKAMEVEAGLAAAKSVHVYFETAG